MMEKREPEKFHALQLAALKAAANSIVIADGDGRIQWANPAFTHLTGYSLEDAIGQNPRFLKSDLHPEAFYRDLWETILDHRVWHGEMVNRKKDGTLYTEEMTITPVNFELDQSQYFIAVKQDVTKRREAEENLRQAEERFRALSDFAAEWIFWRDADGKLVYISPACEQMTGYTLEELYHNPSFMEEMVLPEDRVLWDEHQRSVHENSIDYCTLKPLEFRIRTKEGHVRWISHICSPLKDDSGRFLGIRGSNTDITERRQNEEDMRLAGKVFENTSEGVLVTDEFGNIVFVNKAFERISGYAEEEVIGKNPRILKSGQHQRSYYLEMWQVLTESGEWQGEIWNRRKNGEIYPEWLTISAIKDNVGHVVQYAAVFSDLTSRKQHEERIKHLAYHDALTGLPNRYLFLDRLTLALARAHRTGAKIAVLFLDLDRFKDVNDTLGHAAGDMLLKEVGKRLEHCLREEDTVARMGGDEFTVLLPEINDVGDIEIVARKVLEMFTQPLTLEGEEIFITASLGIAVAPEDGQDAQTLLRHADMAMYKSKEQGKNRFGFFRTEMSVQAHERLTVEQRLRRALERDEFVLHYQPQVDVYSKQLIGIEALLRWQSPEAGLVPPMRFIPVAEETGLILPIGEWVLRTACRQNVAWQEAGFPPLRMAVNLSARQFHQENLVGRIEDILMETGLSPNWLELEITETVAMHNVALTSSVLRKLKGMGIHIAIDDFGTGYSSLNYLKRFPIDTLKVDQSFIRDSVTDPEDAAIVATILVLARNLNYLAIAEGVETPEQLEFLQERECDGFQGYLISEPLPAEGMTELLLQLQLNRA